MEWTLGDIFSLQGWIFLNCLPCKHTNRWFVRAHLKLKSLEGIFVILFLQLSCFSRFSFEQQLAVFSLPTLSVFFACHITLPYIRLNGRETYKKEKAGWIDLDFMLLKHFFFSSFCYAYLKQYRIWRAKERERERAK